MSVIAATLPRVGDLLVSKGYCSGEDLGHALKVQKDSQNQRLLGEILVDLEICTEEQVMECLAMSHGIPYAKLDPRLHDPHTIDLLPREMIERDLTFPLFCVRGTLTIAVCEPSNPFLVDELRIRSGKEVQIVAASARDIRRMITTLPDSNAFVIDDIIESDEQTEVALIEEATEDLGDVEDLAGKSPVIRLVNYIISMAVKEGASDIHVEPGEKSLRIRHRIDGRLYRALEVPLHLLPAVSSRIKIMAGMDISERRLPQDGRVNVLLNKRKVDLRVSSFPGARGEKTVIRVLDTRSVSLNLHDLGFTEQTLTKFQRQIHAPNGIALVTGPTGSGKSTTLYAALNEIATMHNNVCTVEDPIEYNLPLINQFQVQEKIGMTFPKALRTLLRQDPDVIMVGEIRDEETARTAVQAALTGHLVLSTLHTNDATSALTRLMNMGIEPYLISAALNMALAQRLVRRICPRCKGEYEPPRGVKKTLETLKINLDKLHRGAGCRQCRNTGHSGRLAVHELFVINDEVRDAVVRGASMIEIRKMAIDAGMTTLLQDGFKKVAEGLTTVEETLQLSGEFFGLSDDPAR
ncbi:MAG TPA: ATPase, T2SS/T4P/T4SS family [Pirellulaceae bacterium]|nr:ATPase, T2SS/T4P/T4SS family [Pirellulaceae bacterium]